MADEVLVTAQDGIATVTLNRPDKRNAMNAALLAALATAFDGLDANRDVRVIVVRGAGTAFCSGMDLREMEQRQGEAADPERGVIQVLQRVERSRHPTIAMIHGDALAGGCEPARHCDLRVSAEAARLGLPLARDLLFTGRPSDARRAWEVGMVHQVVPQVAVEEATYTLARSIAANAPLSPQGMKAVLLRSVSAREGISHHDLDDLANRARKSADASEGR